MQQHAEPAGEARARTAALRVAFAIWGGAMLLIASVLMAPHWVALPIPATGDVTLQRALAQPGGPAVGKWQLVHVLYGDCRCSQRILDYLSQRATPAGVSERVLFVGRDDERANALRARGAQVLELTRKELAERFHIESAPLLVITDPASAVRYVGGYTARQQGLDFQDLSILAQLRDEHAPAALPAYGCGVSQELQSQLDPIGIKYGR